VEASGRVCNVAVHHATFSAIELYAAFVAFWKLTSLPYYLHCDPNWVSWPFVGLVGVDGDVLAKVEGGGLVVACWVRAEGGVREIFLSVNG